MIAVRKTVYSLLNPDNVQNTFSKAVNIAIIFIIIINVFSVSLETVDFLYAVYAHIFFLIEVMTVCFFTLEYILRLWSAPENPNFKSRTYFFFSTTAAIDLLVILPFYLSLFIGIDLRVLIIFRLFRLLKIIRYFEPLAILGSVIKAESRAFISAMFILMILVFIAATGMYFFERNVQPEVFGSIPDSMWWAIVTLTTLGYGDIIPVTISGRIFASIVTILSIGTVALPAGMLASRFSEELNKRKQEMSAHITTLLADGHISQKDTDNLEFYRDKLCLSKDDIQKMLEHQKKIHQACPLCGKGKNNG